MANVNYVDPAGRLHRVGQIPLPDKGSIPARSLRATLKGIPVFLSWRYGEVRSIRAPDRVSAEKLVAALRAN